MTVVKASQYKKITRELYKKNLDLLNANRNLLLFEQLYKVMVGVSSIKELTQQFIDVITSTLKFSSGLVAIKKPGNQLQIIAMTKSTVNKSALKLIGSSSVSISLKNKENILIKAFETRTRKTTQNILDIWNPLLTKDILKGVAARTNIKSIIVYPIVFDKEIFGSFSVSLSVDVQEMTDFEKSALKRVATLFGIAIDRIKISQSLKKSNKRLKEVSALKDEFVSLTSHELRTPLTAINGSLSTILEGYAGKINNKVKEFLEGTYNESTRLLRLVNNLLNISRIEAGRLKFAITAFDLTNLIKQVGDTLKIQAQEKKLDLVLNGKEKVMVKADQDKVREILINLIGNAIKFTEKGKVSISWLKKETCALIAVEDTGSGISLKNQPKLFRKFERVDGVKASNKKGGTGLGLYICRNLIKNMGGNIWLKSEHGRGSTFFFTLPLS